MDNFNGNEDDDDFSGVMPDGNVTLDVDEYVEAWRDLGNVIETLMPGYTVIGYDPDFLVAYGSTSTNIPVAFVIAVRDLMEKAQ